MLDALNYEKPATGDGVHGGEGLHAKVVNPDFFR
jgi:hypothetical protein